MDNFLLHKKYHLFAFFLLALSIGLLYANTLHTPFIFDDAINIQQNYSIKLQEFTWEGVQKVTAISPNRWRILPNLSFALNYYLDGSNVFGYHLVNIIVHIAATFVFFLLAEATLKLPGLANRFQRGTEIAFAAALLWAVHPLQTNAVTYIVQRMTSMAALFFLLALFCYIKGRIHDIAIKKILLFGASAFFGVMAMFSKENSGMLPIIILGYELLLLSIPSGQEKKEPKTFLLLTGGTLILFLLICWLFLGNDPLGSILGGYDGREFTLGQRLLTEARIIFHYLSLLILPLPSRLNLAYDYQLSTSLLVPPQTLLAIAGIAGLLFLIHFLYKRDRLTSFAIFWFLANLAVESTFIPLELIFEHRMYMPSMFLILTAIAWYYRIIPGKAKAARLTLVTLIAILALFTWQRNNAWKNEVTLWSDVVQKSPGSLRAHANLGNAYNEIKKFDLAERFLKKAVIIGQDDKSGNFSPKSRRKHLAKVHNNLAMIYRETNNHPLAIHEANLALEFDPSSAEPLVTLGIVFARLDQHQKAYGYFKTAQIKGLESVDLYNNWAVSSFNLGMIDQAIYLLMTALKLDPEHPESHYNLGIAYSSRGMLQEAEKEMALAMRLRQKNK